MAYKEQTLLRSRVEIHIPCPDANDALHNENSVVMQTARMFASWFGETRISETYKPNFCGRENVGVEIVFVVLSFCTTETLNTYIVTAISYARNLAKEIGRDRIDMVVNGTQIHVKPV